MIYIQRKGNGYLETIDEYTSLIDAEAMLDEYRLSDSTAHYYLSTKACKAWKEKDKPND